MKAFKEDELRIGRALREVAAGMAAETQLPDARRVWLRAERERRRLAMERAMRPLRWMQGVGVVVSVLVAAWMVRENGLSVMAQGMLEWAVLAVALVGVGCGVLLRLGRAVEVR